jgi:hypothetical protein
LTWIAEGWLAEATIYHLPCHLTKDKWSSKRIQIQERRKPKHLNIAGSSFKKKVHFDPSGY